MGRLASDSAPPAGDDTVLRHLGCLNRTSCPSGRFLWTGKKSVNPAHLCKVLLGDAARPLDAELQRPAGVGHVGALDQHPLDEQTVLRRVPDVGVAVAVHALEPRTPNNENHNELNDPFLE